ncbi:hypothetical protein ABZ826_29230 [Streptomyces sp. NPDC047515]|uniref:hypothetical protein n=1 Tax=Streptomyces sp. NPDC047515 TaxID=3155380 RepID=UPI0033BFF2DF
MPPITGICTSTSATSGGAQKYRLVRTVAGRSLAGTVRRELTPGQSLALLETEGESPWWAAGTAIGTAIGALRTAAHLGSGLLSDEEQTLVRESVAAWDGVTPLPLHEAGLPDRDELPGARLALLAARAPYRISDDDVAAWLVPPYTDHCLVHLIAFGAICAVDRIEATLTTSTKEHA